MKTLKDILELADEYINQLPPMPDLPPVPEGNAIAGWIDHTLLKPDASNEQIKQLCQEAREYQFASVCVNPVYVPLASALLRDSGVETCTVVGFPLGATPTSVKVIEAMTALLEGAIEIDMVMNIGALKSDAYGHVYNDVRAVVDAVHNHGGIVKVILEMALLDQREKVVSCLLCKYAGADFVKTSTGFGPGGATQNDVQLMRRVVGSEVGVKAAGGIRTYQDAVGMIEAGANRIGASAGVKIVEQALSMGK